MNDILILKTVKSPDLIELIKNIKKDHPGSNLLVLSETEDDFSPLEITEIKRENGMLNFFKMNRELKSRLKKMKFSKLVLPVYEKKVMFYKHPLLLSFYVNAGTRILIDVGSESKASRLNIGFIFVYMFVDAFRLVRRHGRRLLKIVKRIFLFLLFFLYMSYFFFVAAFLEIKFFLFNLFRDSSDVNE